jgi:hypothetical protein
MGVKMLRIMLLCKRDDVSPWNAKFVTASTFEKCKCVSVTLRCVYVYRSLLTCREFHVVTKTESEEVTNTLQNCST